MRTKEKCYLDHLNNKYAAEKEAVSKLYNDYENYLKKFEAESNHPVMCFGYKTGKSERFADIFGRYSGYESFDELTFDNIEGEMRKKYFSKYFLEPHYIRTLATDGLLREYTSLAEGYAACSDPRENIADDILAMRSRMLEVMAEKKEESVITFFDGAVIDGKAYYLTSEEQSSNVKTYKGANGKIGIKLNDKVLTIKENCYEQYENELNYYAACELIRKLECIFSYVSAEPYAVCVMYNSKLSPCDEAGLKRRAERGSIFFKLKFFKNGKVRIILTELGKNAIRRINLLVGLDRGWLPSWITTTKVKDWRNMPEAEMRAAFDFKPLMPRGDEEFEKKIAFPYFDFNVHDSLVPGEKYAIVVDCKRDNYVERRVFAVAEFLHRYNNDDIGLAHKVFVPTESCKEITEVRSWEDFEPLDFDTLEEVECCYKSVEIGSDEWVKLLTTDLTDKATGLPVKVTTEKTLFLNREVEFLIGKEK